MIDAVTYGMIPSAKSEKRESAEPEKRFSSERMPPPLKMPQRVLVYAQRRHPGAEAIGGKDGRMKMRSSGTRHAFASQPRTSSGSPGGVATLLVREHQAVQGRGRSLASGASGGPRTRQRAV